MTIDDIKKAIREIEISYNYSHRKEDYDIVLNLTELANLIKTLQDKAIDDFADKLKQDVMTITFGLRICDIDRIAEQLKAGEKNG